jgi:hypothetical protein
MRGIIVAPMLRIGYGDAVAAHRNMPDRLPLTHFRNFSQLVEIML